MCACAHTSVLLLSTNLSRKVTTNLHTSQPTAESTCTFGGRERGGGGGRGGREEGRREEDIEVQQLTDGADHAMSSS